MGPIVKITLKSQETQAPIMVWVVLRLKEPRNTNTYNGLDSFSNLKSRNTGNYDGLGDLPTQETKKLKLSADGRELSMRPVAS